MSSSDVPASANDIAPPYPELAPIPFTAESSKPVKPPSRLLLTSVAVLQIAALVVPMLFFPGNFTQFLLMFYTPILGMVLLLGWWLFFRRLSWAEKLLGLGCVVLMVAGIVVLTHPSMYMGLLLYGVPTASVLMAGIVWGSRHLVWQTQRKLFLLALALGMGVWLPVRLEGITGSFEPEFAWRWATARESRPELKLPNEPMTPSADETTKLVLGPTDWPQFRGPAQDSRVVAAQLPAGWQNKAPKLRWRVPVGPAWSSFCVVDGCAFTQEQRDDAEAIVCLDLKDGSIRWLHRDVTKFNEVVSGTGPRATPTFAAGRLYSVGGDGLVNCLNPVTGTEYWQRDLKQDAAATPPVWGFSSSPLVIDGVVIVYAAGEKAEVVGYDAVSGDIRWTFGQKGHSYASPHLVRWHDQTQVLMATGSGLVALAPQTGKPLWQYSWDPIPGMPRVVQPLPLDGPQVLLGTGYGIGTRQLQILQPNLSKADWAVKDGWTSNQLKPYFNDFVWHNGYLYGFDDQIFTCIDAATGKRQWKKGRYGFGQVLLIADDDVLIIQCEAGNIVYLRADPKKHEEIFKYPALTDKTWNHPVVAEGVLLVRNGLEALCFDLSTHL